MVLWTLILIQSHFLCKAHRGKRKRWSRYFLCSLSLYFILWFINPVHDTTDYYYLDTFLWHHTERSLYISRLELIHEALVGNFYIQKEHDWWYLVTTTDGWFVYSMWNPNYYCQTLNEGKSVQDPRYLNLMFYSDLTPQPIILHIKKKKLNQTKSKHKQSQCHSFNSEMLLKSAALSISQLFSEKKIQTTESQIFFK